MSTGRTCEVRHVLSHRQLETLRSGSLMTATTVDGPAPERFRTHHVTYRQPDGEFVEVLALLAEAIRRIHEGESVGALFNPPGLQLPLHVR